MSACGRCGGTGRLFLADSSRVQENDPYACPDCLRFCPMCRVDLGLHGTDDPSDDGFDCRIAAKKADLLADFGGLLGASPTDSVVRGVGLNVKPFS